MLLQTVHDKPIMAGYLSRKYDSPIINSCSAFWGFISPLDVPRDDIAAPLVVNKPLDVLNFYGIRYISLYTSLSGRADDPVGEKEIEAYQQILGQVEDPDKLIFAGGLPRYSHGQIEGPRRSGGLVSYRRGVVSD